MAGLRSRKKQSIIKKNIFSRDDMDRHWIVVRLFARHTAIHWRTFAVFLTQARLIISLKLDPCCLCMTWAGLKIALQGWVYDLILRHRDFTLYAYEVLIQTGTGHITTFIMQWLLNSSNSIQKYTRNKNKMKNTTIFAVVWFGSAHTCLLSKILEYDDWYRERPTELVQHSAYRWSSLTSGQGRYWSYNWGGGRGYFTCSYDL
jgi:hypothetical protein